MEGNICQFSVENHKIQFTPDSFSEVSSEKKEAVEKQISDLI